MKKIFLLIPDGVSMRNFVYTGFYPLAKKKFGIHLWNLTDFSIHSTFGYNEIKISNPRLHPLTDIVKNAKIRSELKYFARKFDDEVFLSYIFKKQYNSVRSFVKNTFTDFIEFFSKSPQTISRLYYLMEFLETKTPYYDQLLTHLKTHKPDFVLVASQRTSHSIAAVRAAKKLKIPTGTFIFSWDNLPKATLLIRSDYYFVWSEYMKQELLKYYPFISEEQILVTGTPQFEPHYDKSKVLDKTSFFEKYNLDVNKEYICFSGDDITTSPYDEYYLDDLAESIKQINNQSEKIQLGIIYRPAPTDISGRADRIIEKHEDIIRKIPPLWEAKGKNWNQIMPLPEDLSLLANIARHSKLIVNVGSSMVFDGIIHNTPTAYINYNHSKVDTTLWKAENIYRFIRFNG